MSNIPSDVKPGDRLWIVYPNWSHACRGTVETVLTGRIYVQADGNRIGPEAFYRGGILDGLSIDDPKAKRYITDKLPEGMEIKRNPNG